MNVLPTWGYSFPEPPEEPFALTITAHLLTADTYLSPLNHVHMSTYGSVAM